MRCVYFGVDMTASEYLMMRSIWLQAFFANRYGPRPTGTHDDHLTANVEALNDVSAKCSNEYFVASNLCSEYEARIPLIGSWSNLLSGNELEQLLAELTQDL